MDTISVSEGRALFVAGLVVGAALVLVLVCLAGIRAQRKAANKHPGGLTVEKL